jgi:cytochrome c oxidase assembly factor 6
MLTYIQVDYFKKQRIVNYKKEQTIKRIEAEGGEVYAPPPSPKP